MAKIEIDFNVECEKRARNIVEWIISLVFDNIFLSMASFWGGWNGQFDGNQAATRQHLVLSISLLLSRGKIGQTDTFCRCWLLVNFVAIFGLHTRWARNEWRIRWDNERPRRSATVLRRRRYSELHTDTSSSLPTVLMDRVDSATR